MDELNIQANEQNPRIELDPFKGQLKFIGRFVPEDPLGFFKPVFEWVEEYLEAPHDRTDLIIKVDFFNTRSSKVFLDLLRKMESLSASRSCRVNVYWYYHEDDEEMKEVGVEYEKMLPGLSFYKVPEKVYSHNETG